MVVHTIPKDISPNVNVMARTEFELAFYDSIVPHFEHNTMRTSLCIFFPHTHTPTYLRTFK